ncbi:hypothetical protein FRC11_013655 [Ceratobasidium sp. 423]|nr:hypothetical protein FRC11_013655 [Ceratobasidium sp. 423]
MSRVSHIVGKVRDSLHRSVSSSSDEAPSSPSSPGPKQEGRERHEKLAQSLETTIENSEKPESANTRNYVIDRKTKEKKFEDMPIYARIGMHLIFNRSYLSQTLLGEKRVDKLLRDQSFKQGQIYDREDPAIVQPHIKSFVEEYEIDTSQLLHSDLSAYKTFNEFFARRLRPDTRPVDAPEDPGVITSAADCRLTVWNNVATATKVWVKGKHFSVPELLGDAKLSEAKFGTNPSLAIFRLAPADYHRFHSPCAGAFTAPTSQGSKYYTVNPQAVNTELDVFTANRRDIRIIESNIPSVSGLAMPVGIVAVGALLVGSVNWVDKSEGYKAAKGEDIGWFQYGGSTVIAIFPGDRIKWDDDLVAASEQGIEVQVRACERIGQAIGAAPS